MKRQIRTLGRLAPIALHLDCEGRPNSTAAGAEERGTTDAWVVYRVV